MEDAETRVILPPGGGQLACWERHYTLLEGDEIDEALGFSLPEKQLLLGHYVIGSNPGRYWHDDAKELPMIHDGGYSFLTVLEVVGEEQGPSPASCSRTINGDIPPGLYRMHSC